MQSYTQYILLITPLGQNYRIEINQEELINSINVLKKIKETIHNDCNEFKIKKISYDDQFFHIAYDKEGIYHNPQFNSIGSVLCNYPENNIPIYGNIIIFKNNNFLNQQETIEAHNLILKNLEKIKKIENQLKSILPPKGTIKLLKELLPANTKIKLIEMNDPQAPEPGTIGTIQAIDDIGNIKVKWENNTSLSLIYNIDKYEIL